MPLAFESLSHGTIAFGFFNIESDLLLLDRQAIAPEESYLVQKFGDRYMDYRSRVRRWI